MVVEKYFDNIVLSTLLPFWWCLTWSSLPWLSWWRVWALRAQHTGGIHLLLSPPQPCSGGDPEEPIWILHILHPCPLGAVPKDADSHFSWWIRDKVSPYCIEPRFYKSYCGVLFQHIQIMNRKVVIISNFIGRL